MQTKEALEKEIIEVEKTLENVIKIKVGVLAYKDVYSAFTKLRKLNLRASIGWRLMNLAKQVDGYVFPFETARMKLCTDLCKKDEQDKPIMKADGHFDFTDENRDKFAEQFDELANEEVQFEFKKLSLFDLGDAELSTNDLMNLEWLFKLDDD